MRVLHITPYFAPAYCYGGPPRSILSLCHGLQQIGVESAVLSTSANGDRELSAQITREQRFEGIRVHYTPRTFPKRFFAVSNLAGSFDEQKSGCDLVHIHGCWNYLNWWCMRECRRQRIPYLISPRGMLDTASLRRSRMKKQLAYLVGEKKNLSGARAFCVSTAEEQSRLELLGIKQPITVIANPLDISAFSQLPNRDAERNRLGISADETVVLYVGRLHPQKGVELLGDAMREIRRRGTRSRLLIAGTGNASYVELLQRRFQDLVDDRTMIFAGQLNGNQRLAAFAAADVFAIASECESFGMSIAEAMAAGLPVAVSEECPWPDIETQNAGLRVKRSASAFADAISRLCSDRELRMVMGNNGQHLVTKLSPRSVASSMWDLYKQCLDSTSNVSIGRAA